MPAFVLPLSHGERLLVRTVRRLALTAPCHGLRDRFEDACGCAGHQAYRALEVFLQQLGAWGRRRLVVSVPTDPNLTQDEADILEVFACAQAEDYSSLDARLEGLLAAPAPPSLGAAACLVAQVFALSGLILNLRCAPDAALAIAAE